MLHIEQLRHSYDAATAITFPDWQLAHGAQAVLIGPSGSGKTTLLSLVGGMLKPMHGKLLVAGQDMAALTPSQMDRFRGQTVGLVPQRLHLIASLTVAENLQLAQYLAHLPQDTNRVSEVLKRLGLEDYAKRRPHQLSQGQAQRVAIARAVINRPKLLLADEPTASLDDASTESVIALLQREAEAVGASLLITSHDSRVKSRFALQLELKKLASAEVAA